MPTPKPPAMTEEERKARKRERNRRYREANPASPEKVQERNHRYREANPEKVRESRQHYYVANREKLLENRHLYRNTNKEKLAEAQRQYRKSDPQRTQERDRRYREANPEKAREDGRRRRAIKMRATFPGLPRTTSLAVALRRQLFNNSCAYCGGPGPFHDDHVEPLSRGGLDTPSNLVPACVRCNKSKWAKPVEAWYLSQPFFCPDRWAALKRHTGRKWSEVEQLTLLEQHP